MKSAACTVQEAQLRSTNPPITLQLATCIHPPNPPRSNCQRADREYRYVEVRDCLLVKPAASRGDVGEK